MHRTYAIGILALALAASPAAAQERPSAVGRDLSGYSGFAGLDTRFGDMNGDFAVFVGGHAALLLKQRVYVGLSGAGLVSGERVSTLQPGGIDMGYGGLLVGYIVPTSSLVHLTVDALLAGGGVKLADAPDTDEEWDAVFVFEPSVGAELKLARVLRIGFGVGYRFVGAVDTGDLTDEDLRGVTGTATLRLGWF